MFTSNIEKAVLIFRGLVELLRLALPLKGPFTCHFKIPIHWITF